jgi:hypothetical protein
MRIERTVGCGARSSSARRCHPATGVVVRIADLAELRMPTHDEGFSPQAPG